MKRIILTTFGSFGDLHPFLAIAAELKARGHQPILATSETYRQKVCELGLDFHAVRPDLPTPEDAPALVEKIMDATHGTEFLFKELLMPALRDSYHDILSLAQQADCLLTHPITFGAHLAAQQLKIPWISAVLAPISLWSAFDPPVPPVAPWMTKLKILGPNLNRALMQLPRAVTARWTHPVSQLRHEIGLPRGAHPVFEGSFSPHLVLALFSAQLAEPQPDWPPHTEQTGFCFHDRRGPISFTAQAKNAVKVLAGENLRDDAAAADTARLEAFLQSGPPPLVFTLGSSAVMAPGEFFQQSRAAVRQLKQRAVFLIGDAGNQNFATDSDFICAVAYAPHSQIFPRAAAVVHQGGVGTTAQAMRAGVPQLIMPFSHDQFDNGQRIARRGAGRVLSRRKYFGPRVAHELAALQRNSKYLQSAQQIAAKMQEEHGAQAACEAIEKYLVTASQ